MSTKNLARTVIEGGRRTSNQFFRRHSNGVERAHAHQLECALRLDADAESAVFQPRNAVGPSFADKLGPARRWLRSQVGRPWNKVRAELFARFDTRTTAGRHILFCHLLKEVDIEAGYWSRYADYAVSRHGILQRRERPRFVRAWRYPRLPEPEGVLRAWLGARRVIERAPRLYWLVATPHGGFRQERELSAEDATRFRALPAWFREQFDGALAVPTTSHSRRVDES